MSVKEIRDHFEIHGLRALSESQVEYLLAQADPELRSREPTAPDHFRADEVVAQFWKDEVEPKTGEPFTQDYADLLEAFALWIHDTFDLVRTEN